VFGLLGMALLSVPDLVEGLLHRPLSTAEYPVVRMAGFLVMLPYGGGWMGLGYSLWKPRVGN